MKIIVIANKFAIKLDDIRKYKLYLDLHNNYDSLWDEGDPLRTVMERYFPEYSKFSEHKSEWKIISKYIIEMELRRRDQNPHIYADIFNILDYKDQLKYIELIPLDKLWGLHESLKFSHINYSDVLTRLYERFREYLIETGKSTEQTDLILGDLRKNHSNIVFNFYERWEPFQAIREEDNRLVQISDEGELEGVPAPIIDIERK